MDSTVKYHIEHALQAVYCANPLHSNSSFCTDSNILFAVIPFSEGSGGPAGCPCLYFEVWKGVLSAQYNKKYKSPQVEIMIF